MTADLQNPIFSDETKARDYLESVRWPKGPVCPHCGASENIHKLAGQSHRPGLYVCNQCRGHFSVTVGTLYERSHVPLHKWLLATHLLTASKKGISAHQLHRMLGVTYKTAWFMAHRIREAMPDAKGGPLGGKGKIIEADETYIGSKSYGFSNDKGWTTKRGTSGKRIIFTLVERGGRARSVKIEKLDIGAVNEILTANASRDSQLMTDEFRLYRSIGKQFDKHMTVKHVAREYVRGIASTNTVEGFFSIFKRGMRGVYQHCGEQHLQRYLNEFDFRYSNRAKLGVSDAERCTLALQGIEGKRLTYRRINERA
jgi:transposase-like protein